MPPRRRTQETIRGQVLASVEEGDAAMIWKALADQGFDFATTVRNRHMPADFDGPKRVSFFPRE